MEELLNTFMQYFTMLIRSFLLFLGMEAWRKTFIYIHTANLIRLSKGKEEVYFESIVNTNSTPGTYHYHSEQAHISSDMSPLVTCWVSRSACAISVLQ